MGNNCEAEEDLGFNEMFDELVGEVGKEVLSLQLTNFGEMNYVHGNIKGKCSDNIKALNESSDNELLATTFEYGGKKYVFLKPVQDGLSSFVFSELNEGKSSKEKSAMLITKLGGQVRSIAVFRLENMNVMTTKILRFFDQYSLNDD